MYFCFTSNSCFWFCHIFEGSTNFLITFEKIYQVKLLEYRLSNIWNHMSCLSRSYQFEFLKAVFHKFPLKPSKKCFSRFSHDFRILRISIVSCFLVCKLKSFKCIFSIAIEQMVNIKNRKSLSQTWKHPSRHLPAQG